MGGEVWEREVDQDKKCQLGIKNEELKMERQLPSFLILHF